MPTLALSGTIAKAVATYTDRKVLHVEAYAAPVRGVFLLRATLAGAIFPGESYTSDLVLSCDSFQRITNDDFCDAEFDVWPPVDHRVMGGAR